MKISINSIEVVYDFLNQSDWQLKENSNNIMNIGMLNKHIDSEVCKDFWLREVYPEEIAFANIEGDIHIHDLGCLTLYCCGYSLESILMLGVRGVSNIPTSAPARHFGSILNQVANLTTVFQNEIAGAVAFNSFDTLLAPFIKYDHLSYKQVKQEMQNFIYSINSNSRIGAEPAFSNITFDLYAPKDLAERRAIIGGELVDFTFGDCQKEMDMLNKAFFEIMIAGDAQGKLFSYPIPTYNIHEKFNWENPNNELLWEMAGKYGIPYFANFMNSDLNPEDIRSMCPLTQDTKVVVKTESKGISIRTIKDLWLKQEGKGTNYQVWSGKKWVSARLNRTPMTKVYEFTLSNGNKVKMGENHLQPLWEKGTVCARDIEVEDFIPYNKTPIEVPESEEFYEFNRMIKFNIDEDKYKEDSDFHYYSVVKKEEVKASGESLYCFETDDDLHLFTLSDGLITHNCRLSLNLNELRRKNGGLFGSGDSTGSIGVVTINLPRIAYETKEAGEEAFYDLLYKRLELAKDSLEIKRSWLQKNIVEKNYIPAFNTYVGTLSNHFSTIGVVGMNEMCENFLGVGIDTEEGLEFALNVGSFIRDALIIFQQETSHLYNYEATPAESTAFRLAQKDLIRYPDIIQQGMDTENTYYTNSCHLPVKKVTSINENFKHQNELQQQFTGGTVIHNFLEGAISGPQAKALVKSLCENYNVPYISLSPISRYCDEHGYVKEIVDECPECSSRLKKYQRITGYLRCVDNYNPGKAQEFEDRVQIEGN